MRENSLNSFQLRILRRIWQDKPSPVRFTLPEVRSKGSSERWALNKLKRQLLIEVERLWVMKTRQWEYHATLTQKGVDLLLEIYPRTKGLILRPAKPQALEDLAEYAASTKRKRPRPAFQTTAEPVDPSNVPRPDEA